MACLIAEDFQLSNEFFDYVVGCSDNREWAIEVKELTKILRNMPIEAQKSYIIETIKKSRALKKLGEVEIQL